MLYKKSLGFRYELSRKSSKMRSFLVICAVIAVAVAKKVNILISDIDLKFKMNIIRAMVVRERETLGFAWKMMKLLPCAHLEHP